MVPPMTLGVIRVNRPEGWLLAPLPLMAAAQFFAFDVCEAQQCPNSVVGRAHDRCRPRDTDLVCRV